MADKPKTPGLIDHPDVYRKKHPNAKLKMNSNGTATVDRSAFGKKTGASSGGLKVKQTTRVVRRDPPPMDKPKFKDPYRGIIRDPIRPKPKKKAPPANGRAPKAV